MSDEQPDRDRKSLEETLRAIAEEVTKGAERLASTNLGDLEHLARASGIDAQPIKQFADEAGQWLRDQISAATQSGSNVEPMPAADPTDPRESVAPSAPAPATSQEASTAAGLAHPLDMPTEQQGRALAALDSNRWTVEPGTVVLATNLGRGVDPEDAHALGMELHVRDWVDADGELTFAGSFALGRWLDASVTVDDAE